MLATVVFYYDSTVQDVFIDGIYYDAEYAMRRVNGLSADKSKDVHIQTYVVAIPDVFIVEETSIDKGFEFQGAFETLDLAKEYAGYLVSQPNHSDDPKDYLISQQHVHQESDEQYLDPVPDGLGPYIRTSSSQGRSS